MIIRTNDSAQPFQFVYSELEWAAVVAVLPNRLHSDMKPDKASDEDADLVDAERQGLEYVASASLNLSHHHRARAASGFPTKARKQTRDRIAADLAKAEKAGMAHDLPALREALRRADVAVEGFAMLGKVHQRRGDPSRDWLYDAALAMWQRLGGTLAITRGLYGRGKPSGPVIDFMIAALTPVMGDATPGAEALKKRIRRVIKARRAAAARRPAA
jgi:hypothetical protein